MDIGNDSPPSRTTILSSFLRGRPRNTSQSHTTHADNANARELSPSPPQPPSPGAIVGHRRSRVVATPITQATTSHHSNSVPTTGLGLSQMLRRRRSAGNIASPISPLTTSIPPTVGEPPTPGPTPSNRTQIPLRPGSPTVHRIRLVPHIEGRRSLRFDPILRDLREGDPPIRVGRFTDRSGVGLAAINAHGSLKLAFRSKVVSRAHAELWVEPGPKFFVKDTKSSSGTFLNHSRLSPANLESKPFQMRDGDILQLGVDYQGGAEDVYKSVKIRVEVGREWQAGPNVFNTNALRTIRSLVPTKSSASGSSNAKLTTSPTSALSTKFQIPDCCICLFAVTIQQALFIAPCSHAFHYKCIRPYLETHHPAFSCPLCRTYADLDEDVEVDPADVEDIPRKGENGEAVEVEAEEVVECEDADADEDSVGVAPPVSGAGVGRRLRPMREDRGAETEVEMDGIGNGGGRFGLRITTATNGVGTVTATPTPATARVPGGYDLEADEDGDEIMVDFVVAPVVESDGDADGNGGVRELGVGSQSGYSPTPGEIGEGDGDIDIDGTVGGKRKR